MTSGRSDQRPASPRIFLAVSAKRRVAGDTFEQEGLRVLESGEEGGAEQAGGESDHRGVEQRPAQDPEIERGRHGTKCGGERRRTTGELACATLLDRLLRRFGGARAHRPHKERIMRRLRVLRGAEPLRQRLARDAEVLRGERAVAVADVEHAPDVRQLDRVQRRDRDLAVGASAPGAGAPAARSDAAATSSGGRC